MFWEKSWLTPYGNDLLLKGNTGTGEIRINAIFFSSFSQSKFESYFPVIRKDPLFSTEVNVRYPLIQMRA